MKCEVPVNIDTKKFDSVWSATHFSGRDVKVGRYTIMFLNKNFIKNKERYTDRAGMIEMEYDIPDFEFNIFGMCDSELRKAQIYIDDEGKETLVVDVNSEEEKKEVHEFAELLEKEF